MTDSKNLQEQKKQNEHYINSNPPAKAAEQAAKAHKVLIDSIQSAEVKRKEHLKQQNHKEHTLYNDKFSKLQQKVKKVQKEKEDQSHAIKSKTLQCVPLDIVPKMKEIYNLISLVINPKLTDIYPSLKEFENKLNNIKASLLEIGSKELKEPCKKLTVRVLTCYEKQARIINSNFKAEFNEQEVTAAIDELIKIFLDVYKAFCRDAVANQIERKAKSKKLKEIRDKTSSKNGRIKLTAYRALFRGATKHFKDNNTLAKEQFNNINKKALKQIKKDNSSLTEKQIINIINTGVKK